MQSIDLPKPAEDLVRGSRFGKYELVLRIGRGGMATVWVARERAARREDERLVAVKAILHELVSDHEFSGMFLDEGRLMTMIRHPSVVEVYDAGEDLGTMFIAMEWVEGDSLHAIIAEAGKRRPIPPEMAVKIISDAAAGLHAAHELTDTDGRPMNVVHRDVSPHNILIGVDGSVKLVDFGVAKAMGRLSEVTSAGQLKGKFGYMSPEQAMAKKVDRRSDVFALGIVLFELTTGRRLFRGEHDAETLHLVVSGKIPKPTSIDPNYPAALEAIVMRSLERDVNKRYQTAQEFHAELEAYLKSEHIVVARAGIANLLKKVLGERIEQRRKAIVSSIQTLDRTPGAAPLSDRPFAPVSGERSSVSSITSGSGVSAVTAARGSQPSGITGPESVPPSPGDLSSPRASFPSAVSQISQLSHPNYTPGGTVVVKRGGTLGIAIGVIGLAIALLVVLFVMFGPLGRKTTVVNVTSPNANIPTNEGATKPAAPAPVDEGIPAVPVDALGKPIEAPRQTGPLQTKPKPKESAGATPAPPRKNPYE